MVGPVPGTSGLFVAAGHEGSGLTLAPMTARILASQILYLPSQVDPSMDRLSSYLMPQAITAH